MSEPQPASQRRDVIRITRALVSVSDKSGLVELATALANAGVEIVSTGSTATAIADAGLPVTEVAAVTGFPESLGGRVRTLHPAIHSGLLADLRLEEHRRELDELGISPFELVISNLYPFVEAVSGGAAGDVAIEQIDIGGPAMVRAAAKNHANVAVVTSPASYPQVLKALALGGTSLAQRRRFASEAFAHTAAYDRAIAEWFAAEIARPSAASKASATGATVVLRYGENSHQSASIHPRPGGRGIAQAEQLGGKEMSFNNYVDADAAVRAAFDFDVPAAAIVKHANPCGIAIASGAGDAIANAHRRAHECDPVSAFGGVVALNRPVTLAAAESITAGFTEVVVAPGFDADALASLRTKKNLRLLQLPADFRREETEFRQVSGGYLEQEVDSQFAPFENWTLAAGQAADATTRSDLEFAWRAVRSVKSNGILLARGGASVGVGMGQVNRVDSCQLAVSRAGDRAQGSVAASDAFFPFSDGAQVLLDAGISAIVQPGGSVRDDEVIAAVRAAGATMYFTGERHFFH